LSNNETLNPTESITHIFPFLPSYLSTISNSINITVVITHFNANDNPKQSSFHLSNSFTNRTAYSVSY
jgi:hypothetical protein